MNDCIAAIATPLGEGGVGVIRLSGSTAWDVADKLFCPTSGAKEFKPFQIYHGEFVDPNTGQCLDEVLLAFFKAPKSYTGEDVVEIHCHGGVLNVSTLLQQTLDHGARLAQPGEFTRRAFINGKLDLFQAEAVADVVQASSEAALKSAVAQIQGKLSSRLNSMYDELLVLLAQLEAAIDFPEEGLVLHKKEENLDRVRKVQNEMDRLIDSYRQGKIYREGAKVALAGKPNVGKSSLLNALLQEDRAIVTPHAGTTRDTLEERVKIRDLHVNIVDSAGIRHKPEAIEAMGVARTRVALEQADLALVVLDGSQPLDANDELLFQEVGDKPRLVVLNKSDLPQKIDADRLERDFPGNLKLKISATTLEGMASLIDAIHEKVLGEIRVAEPIAITRERHREALVQAREALDRAADSLQNELSEELTAVDVNQALENLGQLLGKTFTEDLLDEIFNDFCIGK